MQTLTINVSVPDELARHFHTLPDGDRRDFLKKVNAFAVAQLRDEETEPGEGVDMEIIALLRAADEEATRVGTVSLEDAIRQAEADNGPGLVARARARTAAYKASQAVSV